jgi:Bardet-Biedl syndrome 2 protein
VVGSADNEIRVFRGEESIGEITESDAVSSLTSIRDSSFGFALSNGAIGSYQKMKKAWSTKSKAVPVALASFDLDGDGVNELITAWDNGKIEARSDKDGSLVFSDKLRAPAAGLAVADYRSDGKQQVIAVSTDGEVRGYSTAADEFARAAIETGIRDKTLQELTAQKLELQAELKSFDSNRAAIRGGKQNAGVIPPNTECKILFEASLSQGGLVMVLNTTNDTVIKLVTVFADNLFDGESFVLHPKQTELSSTVRIPLRISRDVQIDMSVQVMVGYRSSLQDHVFESNHRLPKFASFELLQPRDVREPASGVTCQFAVCPSCHLVFPLIAKCFQSVVYCMFVTGSYQQCDCVDE